MILLPRYYNNLKQHFNRRIKSFSDFSTSVGVPFLFSLFCLFSSGLYLSFFIQSSVSAQSSRIAVTIPFEEGTAETGDLIVVEADEYTFAQKDYHEDMYGVVAEDSAISLIDRSLNEVNSVKVVSSGEAYVKVSSINGNIVSGDLITSSPIEGVAQKADVSGYVLGSALENYESNDPEEVGLILVQVNIRSAYIPNRSQKDLLNFMKSGAMAPIISPLTTFRYLISALVVIASFVIGFSSFGKISGKSVEALGRNPLAGRDIKIAVIFNSIFVFGIMLAGIFLSYLILVL